MDKWKIVDEKGERLKTFRTYNAAYAMLPKLKLNPRERLRIEHIKNEK